MLHSSDQSDGLVQWECRKCGYNNKGLQIVGHFRSWKSRRACLNNDFASLSVSSSSCAKCLLDKYTATTMSMKRRKYCDDCGHLHLDGNYCHMYVDQNSAYDVRNDFLDDESETADRSDTGDFIVSFMEIISRLADNYRTISIQIC